MSTGAAKLLAEARAAGLTLRLDGETVRLSAPAPPAPELIERLRAHKPSRAFELLCEARTRGVEFVVHDGKVKVRGPRPLDLLDELRTRWDEIELLLRAEAWLSEHEPRRRP